MRRLLSWISCLFLLFSTVSLATAGTWTTHEFIYKPAIGARGEREKANHDAGMDRVDARLAKEIWVGDPNYGNTLQDAVTAMGTSQAILRVPKGSHTIATGLAIPTNISLNPERGAILNVNNGVTLTIKGPFQAGLFKVFNCIGTGKVVFGTPNSVFGTVAKVRELCPQWWGAVGDGVADDTISLQAMVDCAIDSGGLHMYIPGGHYKITDTWKLNYGVHYTSFKLRGQSGTQYEPGRTQIDATSFGDRPAINIQGARTVEVSDLYIVGKNIAPSNIFGAYATDPINNPLDPVLANWITPGCVDSQHSPYAGICVDAYYGAAPGDPYPNDAYGRTVTSVSVTFRNVQVQGFVVGMMVAPWGAPDQDPALISAYDCTLWNNTYGYSCGSSQARSLKFYNTSVYGSWVCFTSTRHGNKIGNIPSMYGGILMGAYKLFEFGAANGNNPKTISGIHCESFGWIGELGAQESGGAYTTAFVGCMFWLDYSGKWRPPFVMVAHAKVKFDSCTFVDGSGNWQAFNIANSNLGKVIFDNCHLRNFADVREIFVGLGEGGRPYNHITFVNSRVETTPSNQTVEVDRTIYLDSEGVGRQLIGLGTSMVFVDGQPHKVSKPSYWGNTLGMVRACGTADAVVSGTTHGSTLTFTADDVASLRVGDILPGYVMEPLGIYGYPMLPVFKITDITGMVVTATSMFDGIEATYAPTNIVVYVPLFINTTEATGDTHSNNIIDNVTNITNFRVGDFIQGPGLPGPGTYCARIIDITGTTITLSRSTTATANGVALYNCRLTAM